MAYDYIQKQKKMVAAATVILLAFYSLFFLLQQASADSLRSLVLEQYRADQLLLTKAIAEDFGNDIQLVSARLQELAARPSLQKGDLYGAQASDALAEKYAQLAGIVDRMAITDSSGVATLTLDAAGKNVYVGRSFAYPFVEQAIAERRTVVSDGFTGLDGRIRLGVAHPVINAETGELVGIVGASFSPEKFLLQRGSNYDVSSTFIVAIDRNGIVLAHPVRDLVGKSLDDPSVSGLVESAVDAQVYFERVISGTPQADLLKFQGTESFGSGYPVLVEGRPQYAVFLVTSITTIYSPLADTLFAQNLQAGILIVGATAGAAILIWTWSGWSKNLSNLVQSRTEELVKKNAELEKAKTELESKTRELHDKTEKLEKLDVAKEEFAAMITHELKSPLVPIVGYSELLMSGALGPVSDVHREKLKIIHDSANSLTRLIQDTLDVHRLEVGRLAFDMKEVGVEGMVAEAAGGLAPEAKKRNVAVSYSVEPGLALTCDRNRLIQVLRNLISNSIKFSLDGGGKVDIAARHDGGSIIFSVRDNGIGVPKESQQYLFSKFYQVDTSLTRKTNGSGLGLAIAKGIVGAHAGRIWMESEGVKGRGSTFYFSIPAKKVRNEKLPAAPESQYAERARS